MLVITVDIVRLEMISKDDSGRAKRVDVVLW